MYVYSHVYKSAGAVFITHLLPLALLPPSSHIAGTFFCTFLFIHLVTDKFLYYPFPPLLNILLQLDLLSCFIYTHIHFCYLETCICYLLFRVFFEASPLIHVISKGFPHHSKLSSDLTYKPKKKNK